MYKESTKYSDYCAPGNLHCFTPSHTTLRSTQYLSEHFRYLTEVRVGFQGEVFDFKRKKSINITMYVGYDSYPLQVNSSDLHCLSSTPPMQSGVPSHTL